MSDYADLEIALHRQDAEHHRVELRFHQAASEAEIRLQSAPGAVALDLDGLRERQADPLEYGRRLRDCLFPRGSGLELGFAQAYQQAQAGSNALRVRLFIGDDVPELHGLRWETLQNPVTEGPLATSERVVFSRYLSSSDWRPVRLRRRAELTALIAVANPSDLGDYGLAELEVDAELERARRGLSPVPVRALAGQPRATLSAILDELRHGCDILYLVCHGTLRKGEPWLWLESADGRSDRVAGSTLVERLRELSECPRLIVLASCQSAGSGADDRAADGSALVAVGPRLAEAGVPAVLAMQGNVSLQAVERLMPDLLKELLDERHSGEVDRALAVARGKLRDLPDWWAPALFMRLKTGRIWYVPGFAGAASEFEQWRSICDYVRHGEVVPILGPDVAEHVLGSLQDLAIQLAGENGFPLSVHERNDLAKVAQFISTSASIRDARNQVREAIFKRLAAAGSRLLGAVDPNSTPAQLLEQIVPRLLANPRDPLRILAELDAQVYVLATADPTFETLLHAQGKAPIPIVRRWRDERDTEPFHPDTTAERPYLHYIFGDLRDPATWVLTEDDFFDYLIRAARYKDLLPPVIGKALTCNSLLFIGFRLDDWRFRILFRMIQAMGGTAQLNEFNHVGVQVNPDEHSLADAARAKRYLERYFVKAQVDIYWGSSGDFLQALSEERAKHPGWGEAPASAASTGAWRAVG